MSEESAAEPEENNPNIAVYLRLRPINEEASGSPYTVFDNMIEVIPNKDITEKQFYFTQIFGPNLSQKNVYDRAIYSALRDPLAVAGSTFLSFGTSGAGKTFTTIGTDDKPGIIPRAVCQLYSQFRKYTVDAPMLKTDFR